MSLQEDLVQAHVAQKLHEMVGALDAEQFKTLLNWALKLRSVAYAEGHRDGVNDEAMYKAWRTKEKA